MSDHTGKSPRIAPRVSIEIADEDASREKSSGRATFDPRGSTVWEWKTETGHFSREVSTKRLKKLEAPELSIEKTIVAKKQEGPTPKDEVAPSGGFNPYDHGALKTARAVARPQAAGRSPSGLELEAPRQPMTLLQRLRARLEKQQN